VLGAVDREIEVQRRSCRQRAARACRSGSRPGGLEDELHAGRRLHLQLRARIHRDVQFADRRVVLVDEAIVAANLHATLLRIDVDVAAHVDDRG
jgi:hypothetical protein